MKNKALSELIRIWAERVAELEGCPFTASTDMVVNRLRDYIIDEIVWTEEILGK